MTRARLKWLQSAEPIHTMEQERKIAAQDSGGKFAGYKNGCNFLPPPYADWAYICWSEMHRQHHDRICSSATEWASGHTTEYHLVSVLKNGTPDVVAACSTGYASTDAQCPDPDDDAETKAISHWNTKPEASDYLPKPDDLWKYDPDVEPDFIAQAWMNDCVSAATYPPPEMSRPTPQK
jgi:hypothetical protein